MTYRTISEIATSMTLRPRLVAAAAEEKKPRPYEAWVAEWAWDLASTPGWEEAWESAQAGGVPDPGADDSVITDPMILAAVQPMGDPQVDGDEATS